MCGGQHESFISRGLAAQGSDVVHVCSRYMHREHTQGQGSTCALLSCMWVRQVVAVPSLLTQVSDYIAKQNIDKLDIMLVEIGPNDVRPSHLAPLSACDMHFLHACEKL